MACLIDDLPVLTMAERQAGLHLEGVPFYGQKTDFSTSQIRYSGTKRSNSDSIFMAPSREAIPQLRPDFPETSHLMKVRFSQFLLLLYKHTLNMFDEMPQ